MNATVLDGAVVESEAMVAAGYVTLSRTYRPDETARAADWTPRRPPVRR
jgi:carbonic anhydrase/acetyltransferase-like protein (isoleucine patch superfamily)